MSDNAILRNLHGIISVSPENEANIKALGKEILQYLRVHPDAADSIQGISQWWLPHRRPSDTPTRIEKAIDHLVASGLIEKTILADGSFLYHSVKQRKTANE